MPELIQIHAGNAHEHQTFVHPDDGLVRAKGLIPRNFDTHPEGCSASATTWDIPLIDESEWDERIAEQEAKQSSLQHIRDKGMNGQPIPSRDQNGKGYCWMHSGTSSALLIRAANNQPYADLSAYAGACMIKNYRDEGGNGIDGIEFFAQRGIPTSQFWPQQSMSRSNDNPATWANAAKYMVQDWVDAGDPGQDVMRKRAATILLMGLCGAFDYNWWSHSVCGARLVKRSPFTIRIWNSWSDQWGQRGMGDLVEGHAIPDNMVVCRGYKAAA